jgi:hypothetical protein
MRRRLAPLALAVTCLLAACGGESEGGANMQPGSDCLSCHNGSGEAPQFAAAGTVVRAAGVSGLSVTVTVNGVSQQTTTASSGNFFIRGSGTVTAASINGTAMPSGPSISGHCNSCHTGGGVSVP